MQASQMKKRNVSSLFQFGKWPVFYKLFVGTMVAAVLALVVTTAVSLRVMRTRLLEEIRQAFAVQATVTMDKIVALLTEQVSLVRSISLNRDVVERAKGLAIVYSSSEDPQTWLQGIDREWQAASDDSDLVLRVISPERNELTRQLMDYAEAFPSPVDLLIADPYGALLAATYRPLNYAQAEAEWWEEAQGQFHISQPEYSERVGTDVLSISAPVYTQDGAELVAIVHAIFRMEAIVEVVDEARFERTVWAALFSSDEVFLAGRELQIPGAESEYSWFKFDFQRRADRWYETYLADGTPVLVGHAFFDVELLREREDKAQLLPPLGWVLFVYQPLSDAYRPVSEVALISWLTMVGLIGLVIVAGFFIARRVSVSIIQLVSVVEQEAAGDQNIRAWVYAADETGVLAQGINRLLEEKADLMSTVERRATERAREHARRERDLAVTAAVGEVTSATLDIEALMQQVAELIRDRFGLYFVGLSLVNEARTRAVLQAGTGEAGRALLARGYQVRVGTGLTGKCLADGTSHVDRSVDRSEDTDLPELPYARSEIALPLRSRGELLGVFWAQSYHTDTFDEETLIVLQTIADQVAVAIDSVRLYAEREEITRLLRRAYGEVTREAWEEFLQRSNILGAGYTARLTGTTKLVPVAPEAWRPEEQSAWQSRHIVHDLGLDATGERHLALPITSHEGTIGVINVSKPGAAGEWTQDEIAQLESLTYQLGVALENARTYEDTQSRALREHLMNEAASRIRASLSVDTILQTAAREMREMFGLEEAEMRLDIEFEQSGQ